MKKKILAVILMICMTAAVLPLALSEEQVENVSEPVTEPVEEIEDAGSDDTQLQPEQEDVEAPEAVEEMPAAEIPQTEVSEVDAGDQTREDAAKAEEEPENTAEETEAAGETEVAEETETVSEEPEDETAEAAEVSKFSYAEQVSANSVKLIWAATQNARSYIVSYAVGETAKRVVVSTASATIGKLAKGTYEFTVTACSGKKGKNPVEVVGSISVTVGDWSWAAAPKSVRAVQNDPSETVVTVKWTASVPDEGYGFEVSLKKKTAVAAVNGNVGAAAFSALSTGKKEYYVRAYKTAGDGSKIYGSWSKVAKLTVKVAWMSARPKITGITQTDENSVALSWNAVKNATGYKVYRYVSKKYVLVAQTEDTSCTIENVSYGKNIFTVAAYHVNSLGDEEQSVYAKNKTFKSVVLWSQAPSLSVAQTGKNSVLLTWTVKYRAAGYNIYGSVGKKYVKLNDVPVDDLQYSVGSGSYLVAVGKTYKFKVKPVNNNGREGSASKVVSIKLIQPWMIKPVLSVRQSGTHSAELTWQVASPAERYVIYRKSGKKYKAVTTVLSEDLEYADNTFKYTIDSSLKGTVTFAVVPAAVSGKKTVSGNRSNDAAVTITDYTDITVTKQPADCLASVNETCTFSVKATGDILGYQWQQCSGGEWTDMSCEGCNTPAIAVTASDATNGMKFRCVLTDMIGWTVSTNAAVLTVRSTKATVDGVIYQINDDGTGASVIGYEYPAEEVTVCGSIGSAVVNEIAASAFKGDTTLQRIDIPDSLVRIDDSAFEGCTSLRKMY